MTFLIMLFVILLSMLKIILLTLSVVRHLIYGSNEVWLLNLNLIYETPWTGAGSGFFISMQEKLSWFCLASLITLVPWIGQNVKMDRSGIEEKLSFNDAGVDFLF